MNAENTGVLGPFYPQDVAQCLCLRLLVLVAQWFNKKVNKKKQQMNVSEPHRETTQEPGLQEAHMSATCVLPPLSVLHIFFQNYKSNPHPSGF